MTSALPTDLDADAEDGAPIGPADELAARPDGPFLPPDEALARDPELREAVAVALELPALRRFAPFKGAAWAGVLPLLALAELDRELGAIEGPRAFVRALVSLGVVAFVGWELSRPAPRHPATLAALFASAALRLTALLLARRCGAAAAGLVWVGPALGVVAALAVGLVAPSARAIDAAILARITRAPAPRSAPSTRDVVTACAIAAGLPAILALAGALGRSAPGAASWAQAAVFVAFGALAPRAVRAPASPRPRWRLVGLACGAGFALTLGLAGASHHGLYAASGALRCFLGAGGALERLLTHESLSFGPRPTTTFARVAIVAMTVLVVPWAEERVYRGALQRSLAARLGRAPGLALAALGFGASHFGVYGSAFWQAALLGVGFGAAFEEGGLLVATLVHGAWNAYLLF